MQGPHDVGGRRGYGPIAHRASEPTFHHEWERHAFALGVFGPVISGTNTDAFRHAIERLSARDYLAASYYGRWAHACATLLIETGLVDADDLDRRVRAAGATSFPPASPNPAHHRRPTPSDRDGPQDPGHPRSFVVGALVTVRADDPAGHTRVPGYLRGRRGRVVALRPAAVWPDAKAHGGDDVQWVYAVRFAGGDLWGAHAEAGTSVTVDLFEPHLAATEAAT